MSAEKQQVQYADCNECGAFIPINEVRYCHDCNAVVCNDCWDDHICDPSDMDLVDDWDYEDEDEE